MKKTIFATVIVAAIAVGLAGVFGAQMIQTASAAQSSSSGSNTGTGSAASAGAAPWTL